MNWDDFDAFCQVVDHGGFTAAARALDRPKSILSASVSRLETELGTRLLERTARQLRLTDAGASTTWCSPPWSTPSRLPRS